MEIVRINADMLKQSRIIGSGHESTVYLINGYAYKIFNGNILNMDLRVQSKIDKLHFLHDNCSFDNICYPIFLVHNESDQFIGYGMRYCKEKVNVANYFGENIGLEDKIRVYREVEQSTLFLADKGIFVVDNNLRNFMIDDNNHVIVMDADSISTTKHRTECLPTYFYDYYYTRFNGILDYDFVKYTLALQFISVINGIDRSTIRYYDSTDDIVRDKLLSIFKPYDIDSITEFIEDKEYDKSLGNLLSKHI